MSLVNTYSDYYIWTCFYILPFFKSLFLLCCQLSNRVIVFLLIFFLVLIWKFYTFSILLVLSLEFLLYMLILTKLKLNSIHPSNNILVHFLPLKIFYYFIPCLFRFIYMFITSDLSLKVIFLLPK